MRSTRGRLTRRWASVDIESLNCELERADIDSLFTQSFAGVGRKLVIALAAQGGGPREDHALLLTFDGAAVFQVPSVLDSTPLRLRLATLAESQALIPACSYDASELRDGGYAVVVFTDPYGHPLGHYVLSENVSWEWVPRNQCASIW
jgi:hypothetical protein